jgi:hypothetical protein
MSVQQMSKDDAQEFMNSVEKTQIEIKRELDSIVTQTTGGDNASETILKFYSNCMMRPKIAHHFNSKPCDDAAKNLMRLFLVNEKNTLLWKQISEIDRIVQFVEKNKYD